MSGSIEDRGNGAYRLIVSDGIGQGGKRKKRTKTVHVKNITQAKKELAKFITEIEGGNYTVPLKTTFEQYAVKWMETYAKPKLALKTIYEYERLLNLRIIPAIGHMKLTEIRPLDLVEFINNLSEASRKDIKSENSKKPNAPVSYTHLTLPTTPYV